MDTGRKIAELRRGAGMTQEQLAERLCVSRSLVELWETGARRPDRRSVEDAAALFGARVEDIYDKDEAVLNELSKCIPKNCALCAADAVPLINAFLRELPPGERGVFVRRYHYLQSTVQISAGSGLSESNVRTMLTRTRKRLKKYFKEAAK